jgi:hypothetical protein
MLGRVPRQVHYVVLRIVLDPLQVATGTVERRGCGLHRGVGVDGVAVLVQDLQREAPDAPAPVGLPDVSFAVDPPPPQVRSAARITNVVLGGAERPVPFIVAPDPLSCWGLVRRPRTVVMVFGEQPGRYSHLAVRCRVESIDLEKAREHVGNEQERLAADATE